MQNKEKSKDRDCHICGVACIYWAGNNERHTSACSHCADLIMDRNESMSKTRDINKYGNGFPYATWSVAVSVVKENVFKILPPGTKVEIAGLASGLPQQMTGTLVSYINGSAIIALDREIASPAQSTYTWNQSGDLFNLAKKLGINTNGRNYWCITEGSHNSRINKVISYPDKNNESKSEKMKSTEKIDPWLLIEGDRIEMRIADPSAKNGEAFVQGTYLVRDNNGTALIGLDEVYSSNEHESWDWDWNPEFKKIFLKDLAKKYKVNVGRNSLWSIENNPHCETTVVKILKHQTPKRNVTKMNDDKGNAMSIGQIFIKDSGKAAIRSGATLGIDGLKAGISKMLESQGFDGPGVKSVMKFFDTKLGDAFLRGGLGYTLLGLPIPYIQENEYAQEISEELRVSGLSGGMDQAAAMVKMFILPALLEAFKDTPIMKGIEAADKKARVSEAVAPQRIAAPTAVHEPEDFEIAEDPFKAPKQASL